MKKVIVGLLGCGNIGSGVVKLIAQMREDIRRHYQLEIEVRRALVRRTEKKRIPEVPASILTNDPDQVLNDPDISVVLEFLGGEQPAADYMVRALRAGKSVVTANKMALALHWPELQRAAEESGSGFYYEASVGGAMPIIRMLQSSLQANHITRLSAIINGTTNYLLTRMTDEGMDYQTVLADAQRLGLAEPDPAADVEGEDASYKLSILSSLAFHAHIPVSDIQREGMTHISQVDIKCAGDMGYVIKLVASASREEDVVDAFVSPVLVPKIHPLASVKGAFNAVYLHGHAFDDMMIYGRGAGSAPTASAIVSDLLTLVRMDAGSVKLTREKLTLQDLIEENRHRLDPMARKRRQELVIDIKDPCEMNADKGKMNQVIYNLMENAIKYTQEGGRIVVTLDRTTRNAVLSVKDNGPGIPQDAIPHIFDRFYRVDKARSRETGGTGLGLSIVRQMVLLHGGTIRAESQEGQGSDFIVELPVNGQS